jgi:hypothetical protein
METILHGRVDSAQPETARSATDRAIDDRFFLVAAALAIVVVGLGFGLEFVPGAPANTRPRTPLIMTHAAVFASWIALFAVQTSLVAAGRVRIHRRLGVAAIGLALGMLILGFATAIRGARTGYSPIPHIDALTFLVVPVGDLVVFATLVGTALYWRRTPDVHKRLMWLATAALTFPAVTRLPYARGRVPVIFAVFLLILLAAPIYERVTRGRMHPVSKWASVAVFLTVAIRLPFGRTALWHALANWLVR